MSNIRKPEASAHPRNVIVLSCQVLLGFPGPWGSRSSKDQPVKELRPFQGETHNEPSILNISYESEEIYAKNFSFEK